MEWPEVAAHCHGVAHAATATPDGRPHVSKVWPAVEDDVVWMATGAGSAKARNLRANGRIALVWSPEAEAYVTGEVEVLDDPAEKRRLWDSGLFAYEMAAFWKAPDDPGWVLLRMRPTSAVVFVAGTSGPEPRRWRRGP